MVRGAIGRFRSRYMGRRRVDREIILALVVERLLM